MQEDCGQVDKYIVGILMWVIGNSNVGNGGRVSLSKNKTHIKYY